MPFQDAGALLPAGARPASLLPVYSYPMTDGSIGRLITSYRPESEADAAALFSAIQTSDFNGDWARDHVLEVEHVVIHPAGRTNKKTGEWEEWERTVLVTPSGERIAMGSEGVARAIRLACGFFGPPPWRPARRFKLVVKPAEVGHFYTLDLAK